MSNKSTAFDSLEERARDMQSQPRDRLSLRDYVARVEIGAFGPERGNTQRLRFNIVVEVAPVDRPLADDVDKILSYDVLTGAVDAELQSDRLDLLETLAENIARRLLGESPALRVFVRIEKLDRGPFALGVEIVRDKSEETSAPRQRRAPRLVFVSHAAISTRYLNGWLDQLGADGSPLVLVADSPAEPFPSTFDTTADRRIALLALDQMAWALAAQNSELEVMGSRTELEWALSNSQWVVWAPSKLVLDNTATPFDGEVTATALLPWVAERLGAQEIVAIGADIEATDISTRHMPIAKVLPL